MLEIGDTIYIGWADGSASSHKIEYVDTIYKSYHVKFRVLYFEDENKTWFLTKAKAKKAVIKYLKNKIRKLRHSWR